MNHLQLYEYYLTLPDGYARRRGESSRIYPNYVIRIGGGFAPPFAHRYYTLEEFIDKLHSDENFEKILLNEK